jgi:hypothetical protein
MGGFRRRDNDRQSTTAVCPGEFLIFEVFAQVSSSSVTFVPAGPPTNFVAVQIPMSRRKCRSSGNFGLQPRRMRQGDVSTAGSQVRRHYASLRVRHSSSSLTAFSTAFSTTGNVKIGDRIGYNDKRAEGDKAIDKLS